MSGLRGAGWVLLLVVGLMFDARPVPSGFCEMAPEWRGRVSSGVDFARLVPSGLSESIEVAGDVNANGHRNVASPPTGGTSILLSFSD